MKIYHIIFLFYFFTSCVDTGIIVDPIDVRLNGVRDTCLNTKEYSIYKKACEISVQNTRINVNSDAKIVLMTNSSYLEYLKSINKTEPLNTEDTFLTGLKFIFTRRDDGSYKNIADNLAFDTPSQSCSNIVNSKCLTELFSQRKITIYGKPEMFLQK